jgi:hypothetical protein
VAACRPKAARLIETSPTHSGNSNSETRGVKADGRAIELAAQPFGSRRGLGFVEFVDEFFEFLCRHRAFRHGVALDECDFPAVPVGQQEFIPLVVGTRRQRRAPKLERR